jgi:hypothetical protein
MKHKFKLKFTQRSIKLSVLLFLFFIPSTLIGQFTFQKTYTTLGGATGVTGCFTSDGNYVFAGYSYTSGLGGIYLIKTNEFGDTIWTKKYEESGLFIVPSSIQQGFEGKLIIAGYARTIGSTYHDSFLMNVDSLGNLLWVKLLNNSSASSGISDDLSYKVISLPDSGYLLAGNCSATINFALTASFVIKLDKYGNKSWNQSYQKDNKIEGRNIQQTVEGGFIICGRHTLTGNPQGKIYLLKISSGGLVEWSKYFNGPAIASGEAVCLRQTSDGGYIVAGQDINAQKIFLLKTDSIGNFSWMKTYESSLPDYLFYLDTTKDNGYLMVGRNGHLGSSDYFLIRTNSMGDTIFTKQYGTVPDENAIFAHQTLDAGFLIGGNSNNSIYLVKTDSTGNSVCNMPTKSYLVNDTAAYAIDVPISQIVLNWTISSPSILINSGGAITTLCSTVAIPEDTENPLFHVFPNPSSGNFVVEFSNRIKKGEIEFYNIIGEKILSEKIINESKIKIKLNNILSGVYLIKVNDSGKIATKKIIVD